MAQPDYYSQLVKQYPWLQPFIDQSTQKINWFTQQKDPVTSAAGSSATGFLGPMTAFAPKLGAAGYAGLADILLNKGQIDPALMNRNLTAISRGTEAAQRGQQGQLAQLGLQGSGVGQALNSAIGQAGQERAADYRASEAAQAEARRRQDLQLFGQLAVQPNIDLAALYTGQYNAAKDRQQQKNASDQAFWGQILGALGGFF